MYQLEYVPVTSRLTDVRSSKCKGKGIAGAMPFLMPHNVPDGFGDGTLTSFTESLWIATTPTRFAGIWHPHVMTVVRLATGELLLHSPCRPTDDLIKHITQLGSVAHVVAPNSFHDLYLAKYRSLYPHAVFWAPAVLQSQNKKLVDELLDDKSRTPWDGEMPHVTLPGLLALDECIFFHKRTRTLVVADFLSNLAADLPSPWFTKLSYRFLGISGKLKLFPLLRWFGITKTASFRRVAQQIIDWNPDKLIVGHGTPISARANEQLRAALE